MRQLKRRTRLMAVLAAVAAATAAVLVVGPGYHSAQVRMHSGTVWLASGQTGEVTLVDGAAAEVMAHVPVAAPDTALTVAQRGGAVVVLDRGTGRLSGVDTATERVTPAAPVLPASDGLVVLPAPDALYVVDVHSGMAAAADPATLAPKGEPRRLAEAIRPDGVAVDDRGRLWAIDDRTGDLVWLSDGQRRTRSAAAKNGRLTITGGRPALVDPGRGTAELLDPETGAVTRSARLGSPADDTMAIGGSTGQERLLIAIGSRGELVSCTFDAGCAAPVKIGAAGADLGNPIVVGDHAVVPDHSTGQATIVDLGHSRVVAQRQLFDKPVRFELIAHDDVVFFNDPNGNAAGVLDLSGDVRTITKYAEDPVEDDVRSAPDPRERADQATKIDRRKDERGLGLPSWTDRVTQPIPGPRPTASIVVSPRTYGVVGDEFELTMAVRQATAASTSWSFGDETPAGAGATVRHRWQRPGTFTVRATAALGNGGTTQSETTVTVTEPGAPPSITRISFQRSRPVIGESVHFGADTTGQPDSWSWTVTKVGTATPEATADTAGFDHRFATTGAYTVSLTITTGTTTAQSSRQVTVARGAVKFWGADHFQLGQVPLEASSGVVAIDGGNAHCLALKSDGSVIAWGDNSQNQTSVPVSASSGVSAISSGAYHNLVLKSDGSILAWGTDLGEQSMLPPQPTHDVIAISAGDGHNLALKDNGEVIAWGSNVSGQSSVPQAATSGVIGIAAGSSHSLALKADGSVISWGGDDLPYMEVPDAATSGVVAIAAGDNRSLALKADGTLLQWGFQWAEEPLVPPAAHGGVVSFVFGADHALALKANGSVIGWGIDHSGETSLPPEYDGSVLAIAAASDFSLVVVDDLG